MLCILMCIHERWWDQHSFKYANVNNMNMNIRGTVFPPSRPFSDCLHVICILHTFFPSHVSVCNFWKKTSLQFNLVFLFFSVSLSLQQWFYPYTSISKSCDTLSCFFYSSFLILCPEFTWFFPLLLSIFVTLTHEAVLDPIRL